MLFSIEKKIFFNFNLFLKQIPNITSLLFYFQIIHFWQRQSLWRGQNTLPRRIHRRGTICHVGQRFPHGILAAPQPLTRQHCSDAPSSLAWQDTTLEKLYLFHMISDEDDLYMKIIDLDEIYNFIVLSFFI